MSRVWGNVGRLAIDNPFEECPVCGWQINLKTSKVKQRDKNQLLLFNPHTFQPWYEVSIYG